MATMRAAAAPSGDERDAVLQLQPPEFDPCDRSAGVEPAPGNASPMRMRGHRRRLGASCRGTQAESERRDDLLRDLAESSQLVGLDVGTHHDADPSLAARHDGEEYCRAVVPAAIKLARQPHGEFLVA